MDIKASVSVTIANISDGTGIASTVVEYQAGSSGTSAPTGEWSTSMPSTSSSNPYLWTRVTYTYTDGSDPKIVYTVGSTPEGIEIGGRNLLRNSGNPNHGDGYWIIDSSGADKIGTYTKENNETFRIVNNDSNTRIYYAPIISGKKGETFTVSVEHKVISGTVNPMFQITYGYFGETVGTAIPIADGWIKRYHTFTLDSDHEEGGIRVWFRSGKDLEAYNHTYLIRHFKLEKGNKATDWTPSPEDQVDKGDVINQVNAELNIDGNSIALKAGHFTVESDGLNLDAAGNATFKGDISASTITGSTFNNNNGTFKVDSDGSLTAKKANIEGNISASTITGSSGEFTKSFSVEVPSHVAYGDDAIARFETDNDGIMIQLYRPQADDPLSYINNYIKVDNDGIFMRAFSGLRNGIISMTAVSGMIFHMTGSGTFAFDGADVLFYSAIRVLTDSGSPAVEIWTDNEGGNIQITSPNNVKWQMDAFDGNLRIYSDDGNGLKFPITIKKDGVTNVLSLYIDTNSGMYIIGKTETRCIHIPQLPSGSYVPIIRVNSTNNHVLNFGGIGNIVGFYGFYNARTANGYDFRTVWDMTNGDLVHNCNLHVGKTLYANAIELPRNQDGLNFSNTGKIWSTGNQHLYFRASNESNYVVHLGVHDSRWTLDPDANNCVALGTPNHKWTQLFAVSGAINTSDRKLKDNIKPLTDTHIKFFMSLQPVSFTFKDGTSGRTHVGFISQDVEQAMTDCGLTDLDFAGFCKDQKTKRVEKTIDVEREKEEVDPDTNEIVKKKYTEQQTVYEDVPIEGEYIYSLRYEEFIALNTHVIQHLNKKYEDLKKDIEDLKKVVFGE